MSHTTAAENTLTERSFWVSLGGALSAAIGVSAYQVFTTQQYSLTALIVAGIVALLICRYKFRIPWTKIEISARSIVVIWGVIWLGSGAVFLSLVATAASVPYVRANPKRWFLQLSSDGLATFAVAFLYAQSSSYTTDLERSLTTYGGTNVIAVILTMAALHFAISSALSVAGRRINHEPLKLVLKDCYGSAMATFPLTVAGTLLANLMFVQFGIEFGWVILPVTVIASIAHLVHERRLASKTREISEASRIHLATVEALATAIDARDQMGVGHVRRTQLYAVGIGELMQLSDSEIDALRTAALLHDIGKLAVPDHILNKPGTLTDAEIEKTKIHSVVGASILEKVGFNTPVVPTVKFHHENWDGTGYPDGLRGTDIPLTARILALADAYDTLRDARPYRAAVSQDEARRSLEKDAGRKFDPRLVDVFIEHQSRFEAEVNRKGLGYRSNAGDRLRHVSDANSNQNFVEQIKLANREAFTLYELAKEFSSSLNLNETANLFSEKIREFVQFDTCTIYLLDDKSEGARCVHVAGKHTAVFSGHEIHAGDGVTGGVLATGAAVRSLDPWPDLKLLKSSVTSDYRSMISLPLSAEGKLIGAVSLYSTDPAGYGDEQLRILETINHIASDAIFKSQRHAETESYALTDPMTGLPNARSLQMQYEREVARARRGGSTFQVLMLDLDGFKKVNDTFGHKAGDQMLVEIGRVIKEQLREYDFLARYAGDEFVALIPDTSADAVYELCVRIEKAVRGLELTFGSDTAKVGVSIGSATYPYGGDSFDQLVIAADKGMYSNKIRRKHAAGVRLMIPKPDIPLDLEMPIGISPDDVEPVVVVDETNIYALNAS